MSKDITYGLNTTHLDDEATRFVASMKEVDFQLYLKKRQDVGMVGQKNSTRKYICSRCGLIIRAT